MKSFFCIFCNCIFESRQQIYEHLRKVPYHDDVDEGPEDLSLSSANSSKKSKYKQANDCYSKLNIPEPDPTRKRSITYLNSAGKEATALEADEEEELEDYEEGEKEFADWIERFLLFQDSLQNYCKPINPVNRLLLKGCPVCDKIISIYNKLSPELIDTSSVISLIAYTNGSSLKAKAHVFEHLRYFPYKCRCCGQKNRNKQYSNNEDFKKHVARLHSKDTNLLRKVKLKKLERFVEFSLKPMFM
jgi:hypothetical protein